MSEHLLAKASATIDAGTREVWKALTDPKAIKQYMFGADVVSDWREGGPIVWKGEFKGKPYEDKGMILEIDPERTLQYTHFSALSGKPDKPENYHTIRIGLSGSNGVTDLALTQDNNETEQARIESEKNWGAMLEGLKKYVEK
ncbi:MAG TPA: SRPBCC family protein [Rhodanobacter sp.]